MICGKPTRTYYYCHRCANNPDNRPWPDAYYGDMTYPHIDPLSGDCTDFTDKDEDDAESIL